jgi:hypothetical protein
VTTLLYILPVPFLTLRLDLAALEKDGPIRFTARGKRATGKPELPQPKIADPTTERVAKKFRFTPSKKLKERARE